MQDGVVLGADTRATEGAVVRVAVSVGRSVFQLACQLLSDGANVLPIAILMLPLLVLILVLILFYFPIVLMRMLMLTIILRSNFLHVPIVW